MKVTSKDHSQGAENAPIVIIEYADYQCPYCRQAYFILKDIKKELGDKVRLVFRNFPLTQMHRYALHAALAAEAAGAQGKFWEMHDMIFENQRALTDDDLMEYAHRLHLNTNEFQEDFGKDEYLQKVKEDYKSGEDNGVEGTPTFFINGELYTGNWMGPEFAEYLRSLIV